MRPCVQISSPSGKALFQWVANETTQVDFYICALSFGKNDLGERQRIGATVSIYLNGTFVWCALSLSSSAGWQPPPLQAALCCVVCCCRLALISA